MGDDEKGKGKWANWQAHGVDDGVHVEDEPEVFINLADLKPPLADEDPTPPMGKRVVDTQEVQALNLAAIQERIAKEKRKTADTKRENEELERVNKELDEIFAAVESQDEDFIKGLLSREFGRVEFKNLSELQERLDTFFSGGREHTVLIDMNDFMNNPPQRKEMLIEFRPRVGGEAPFVEFKLVNESGLGKARNKTITHATDVKVKGRETLPTQPPEKEKKSWFGGLFGKKS